MSAKDIMNAMDMLDEDLVLEAKATPRKKRISPRKVFLLAAVIALLGTLALSAVAAADKAGWFRDMFAGQSDTELTPGQETFIRDNTVAVGSSQTQNGYTLTLDSAFTDGKLAYFRFMLIAPEGTKLNGDWYGALYETAIQNEQGEPFFGGEGQGVGGLGWSAEPVEGKENCTWLLLETDRNFSGNVKPLSEHIWTVYVYGLQAGYPDGELGRRYEPLAEGCWCFDVQFPEGCERELELIVEPVTTACRLDIGHEVDKEAGAVNVTTETCPVEITSFRLRALTAELTFHYAEKEQINGRFEEIYAVMKDGTKFLMNHNAGMPNFLSFTFDAPLDLDQVDHILFPDGTILPVS